MLFFIFFFKQKTAYELRISDWSSDVCSSDLTSGLPSEDLVDRAAMLDDMVGADAAGLQLAVHAIGDKANATVLDMFTEVVRRNGPRDRRLRIEHAQHLRPADIARFHDQHVIASMQPYHAIDRTDEHTSELQ